MELESQRAGYEAQGIHVAAASYDSVAILETFAERADITYPLLADPDFEMIKAFGIVNESVPKESEAYGFANAGYYLIDAQGLVTAKFFNEPNNDRTTAASIRILELSGAGDQEGEAETDHLTLRWSASNQALRPGQRGVLTLEVELPDGMHVYAPGVEGGYIPISWTLTASPGSEFEDATYPVAITKHLPAIKETVPVYEGNFRLVREIHLGGGRELPDELKGETELTLRGGFRYQACDARVCYPPLTVPLEWTFVLEPHDRVRVPENIRRGAS